MFKIIVASKNPVKVNSVNLGIKRLFNDLEYVVAGISVSSDVSDQPLSDNETLKGAKNRALHAKSAEPGANMWVGIEGGIEKRGEEMNAFAWVYIITAEQTGKARSGTFYLPKTVVDLINQGKELGEADDIVFGDSNSKQKSGAVGLLTNDEIDRTDLYLHTVLLALIPFKNPGLY
jgi:inosine/xanthosine triphosphatase